MEPLADIFVIRRNGQDGGAFPLLTKTCKFGRETTADIRVHLPQVSNIHCQISWSDDGKAVLEDTSANGTKVNGVFVTDPVVLQHKDIITVVDRSFRFEYNNHKTRVSTPARSPLSPAAVNIPKQSSSSAKKLRLGTPKILTNEFAPVPSSPHPIANTPLDAQASISDEDHESLQEDLNTNVELNSFELTSALGVVDFEGQTAHNDSPYQTPFKNKVLATPSKRVRFGPQLQPEIFDTEKPPATPVFKGQQPFNIDRKLQTPLRKDIESIKNLRKRRSSTPQARLSQNQDENSASHIKTPTKDPFQSLAEQAMTSISESIKNEKCAIEEDNTLIQPSVDDAPEIEQDVVSPPSQPTHRSAKKALATPIRSAIENGAFLRQPKRKLRTPLRNAIQTGVTLSTKRTLQTPLRHAIQEGTRLRSTKRSLATSVQNEIQAGIALRPTKRTLATPLRKAIQNSVPLRPIRRTLATPVRKAIHERVNLRQTKRKLSTPVRHEIHNRINLRPTRRTLATPIRQSIHNGVTLRSTTRTLATPIRTAIKNGVALRQTKRTLLTPLRMAIRQGVALRPTRRALETPIRQAIQDGVTLRSNKRSLATPIRTAIKNGVALRQTKRTLSTPLRMAIRQGVALRPTRRALATPIRQAIQDGVTLRSTTRTLATPIRTAIKNGVALRQTKRTLSTPLRMAIRQGVALRPTRRTLPTPIRQAIQDGVTLRSNKRSLATPIRAAIQKGVALRRTASEKISIDCEDAQPAETSETTDINSDKVTTTTASFSSIPKLPLGLLDEIKAGVPLVSTAPIQPVANQGQGVVSSVIIRRTSNRFFNFGPVIKSEESCQLGPVTLHKPSLPCEMELDAVPVNNQTSPKQSAPPAAQNNESLTPLTRATKRTKRDTATQHDSTSSLVSEDTNLKPTEAIQEVVGKVRERKPKKTSAIEVKPTEIKPSEVKPTASRMRTRHASTDPTAIQETTNASTSTTTPVAAAEEQTSASTSAKGRKRAIVSEHIDATNTATKRSKRGVANEVDVVQKQPETKPDTSLNVVAPTTRRKQAALEQSSKEVVAAEQVQQGRTTRRSAAVAPVADPQTTRRSTRRT